MSVHPSTIRGARRERLRSAEPVHSGQKAALPDPRSSETLAALTLYIAQGRTQQALALIGPLQDAARHRGDQRAIEDLLLLRELAVLEQRRLQCKPDEESAHENHNMIQLAVRFAERVFPVIQPGALVDSNPLLSHSLETACFAGNRHPAHTEIAARRLSKRERQVLQLISTGRSNRAIASELFISEGTVKKHISNLLDKLGSSNRTQAVTIARGIGLL